MTKNFKILVCSILYIISAVALFLYATWNFSQAMSLYSGKEFTELASIANLKTLVEFLKNFSVYIYISNTVLSILYLTAGMLGLSEKPHSPAIKHKCVASCVILLTALSICMNIVINWSVFFLSPSVILLTVWDIIMIVVSVIYFNFAGVSEEAA